MGMFKNPIRKPVKYRNFPCHVRSARPRLSSISTALVMVVTCTSAHAVTYYKANNTTNLNGNASWVDAAGAAIATTPVNGTGSADILIWNNMVTAANTVNMGDNIGVNTIRILDPGGPVVINGTQTFTFTASGGVDMSLATQDLTLGTGTFYRATSGVVLGNTVAAGRVLTINGTVNVRNNSSGGTVNHTGAGTVIYNGTFAPSNLVVASGEVQLNAPGGSTRNGTNTTTINGGRLVISNTSGSATGSGAVTVNTTGTLTGQGIMTGAVTVNTGGTLIPKENAVGSLRTGALSLAAGSTIKWEATDALQSDLIEVANSNGLTINGGTIELYNTGTTTPFTGVGTYNLFSYVDAIGGSGISSLAVAESSKIAGQTYTFGQAGGFVTLRIEVGSRPQSFWNVNANGSWGTASNWTSNGVPNAVSAIANLGGSSGVTITQPRTVTLGASTTVGVLNIDSVQPFTLAGSGPLLFDDGDTAATLHVAKGSHTINNAITLPLNGIVASVTDAASTLTLQGEISGDGGLGKIGAGTLILTKDNLYSGLTSNSAGVLQLGSGGTTGALSGPIANSGTLRFNRSEPLEMYYLISGTGGVELTGTGTITLTSDNTFSGPTSIASGTLEIGSTLALQNSTLTYSNPSGGLSYLDGISSIVLGGLSGDKPLALSHTSSSDPSVTIPISLSVGQNNSSTTYSASTTGTGNTFTKAGTGTFSLSGTHAFSGAATISGGVLSLDTGADLTTSAITLGSVAGAKLLLNGGTLHASAAQSFVANVSAGFDIVSGSATFGSIVTDGNSASGGSFIRITGGTLDAASLTMGRGALNLGTEPATGQTVNGLYINGGAATISGPMNFGTGANSSVSARMDSGSLTVHGATTIAINNPDRWSVFDISGGDFTSDDATTGVRLGGPFIGKVIMHARGGTVRAQRFQFGQADYAGTAILSLSGGMLYPGSGGMVLGTTNPSFVASLRIGGGLLGAGADSASDVPISLTGPAIVTGADASDTPHTVTFSGRVDGAGSLTKNGSGSASFTSPDNSFSGAVSVNSGTLGLGGQTGAVTVATGATLIPNGSLRPQAASTVSGTLGIRYQVGNSIAPGGIHSQGVLTLVPSSVLDISGTGILTAPSYVIASGAAGVSGTFGTVSGVPSGYTLVYNHNIGTGFPAIALVSDTASPYDSWAGSFGLAGESAGRSADPDNDGLQNLIEFALGSSPTQSSTPGAVLGRSGDFLTLSFSHIADPDLTYFIEASETLSGAWTPVHTFPPFGTAGPTTYTDTVAVGSGGRRFLRLSVSYSN